MMARNQFTGLAVALAATLGLVTGALAATPAAVPFQDTAYAILRDSIAMRTVAGYGKVPELARYLQQRFLNGGFNAQDVQLIPYGETMAMLVRYRGDGRSGKKPVLLSAHLDVVDALPEDWERDPYTLVAEDGFLFGRGVADNKFAVAVLSATFLRLRDEGFVPSRDLVLAFSGDEETLMETTQLLTHSYRDQIDADFALVADGGGGKLDETGKPVSFTVDSAEKTYASYTMTARNPGGHSSLPRKDNAINDLAQAITRISAYEFPVLHNELTRSYFAKSAPLVGGDIGAAMAAFAADPTDAGAVAVLRAQPGYVGSTGTTCVTTLLQGGHAENALPQSATATINCRIFPGVSVDATLDTLKSVAANDALEWAVLDKPVASDASPLRPDVFAAIARAVHAQYPGLPIVPHMASGASDSLHFRAAGIPSYTLSGIFLKASDEFAHGLNERVTAASLPGAMQMWYQLLKDLAGD